jgi:hypothetical protein
MLNNNIVDGSKLSNTLDFTGKTISNITLPTLNQTLTNNGNIFGGIKDSEGVLLTKLEYDTFSKDNTNNIVSLQSGDVNISSFWGISCNLHQGRITNLADATQTRTLNQVEFTVNKKITDTTLENLFKVNLDGDVGIGVSNPDEKLHVDGNILCVNNDAKLIIRDSRVTSAANCNIELLRGSDTYGADTVIDWRIKNDVDFKIDTGSTATGALDGNAMTIKWDTGNVGIGKTNPTEKLDVSGNIKCTEIIANNISSSGGNTQFFDGEIIYKKHFKVSLLKSTISVADGTTFYKLGLYNFQPKPNPSGFYSIVYCHVKFMQNYMEGNGTDAVTYQLRGIISNDYDPTFDDADYWLLDEEFGYWNSGGGGGGRFSPSSYLNGGMKWTSGNDNYVFLFYGRKRVSTRDDPGDSFRDPENVDTNVANGWQVETTYIGGPVDGGEEIAINPFAVFEIEQILYENPT